MNPQSASSVVSVEASRSPVWVDQLGAGLSVACALHCMFSPVLVAVLPMLGLGFLVDEMAEVVLLSLAVILAVGSLCWGFRLHKSIRVFFPLGAAVLLIAAGRLFAEDASEIVLVVAGALLLVVSHLLNRYFCRTCLDCNHPEHRALA